VGIARLDELLEIGNLLGSPEHRRELQTKGISPSRFPWAPRIDAENMVGGS
jgi:hypothetical protein